MRYGLAPPARLASCNRHLAARRRPDLQTSGDSKST
jgi:hypothetical protein